MCKKKITTWAFWIAVIAVLGLVFQVAHFYEHLAQFAVWLFGPKNVMYMTPWATDLVEWIGSFFKSRDAIQARLIGIELLHLVGNAIFFVGLVAYRYLHRSRALDIALVTQGIHVLEHVLLTVTMLTLGRPLGITTLFGAETSITFMVSYRIVWHFVLNLIPSIATVVALVHDFRKKEQA